MRPSYFLQSLVFRNHFVELEIVLFQVKLIIDNAPLKYVNPNTRETFLSPNQLLFGRELLYCFNVTPTVTTNLSMKKVPRHF